VQEAGVSPIHFSLHWDGATLRIANTHGAGQTRVNGALLGADWQVLEGRTRLEFGGAVIVLEAQRAHSAHPAAALADVGPANDRARPSSARPLAVAKGSVRPSAIAQSGGERSVAARASVAYSDYSDALGVEGSAAVQRTPSVPAANSEPRTGPVPRAAVRVAEAEAARAEPQPEAAQRGQERAVAAEEGASEPDGSAAVSDVFVLGGSAGGAPERPFIAVPRVIKPASRRSVWLSGLALLGGYALWVYLLHHL
jgi:hypothetical protein